MAFPVNSVLDNFNRGNGGVGANWSTDPDGAGYNTWNVISNQAGPSVAFSANWWNPTQFGPDCEVYCTVAVAPGSSLRLYARIQNPGVGASVSNWELEIDGSSSYISKTINGNANRTTVVNTGILFATGDMMGLECIGNVITAYRKPAAGAWGSIGTVTDSANPGAGFIGMLNNNDTVVRIDDFGGGALAAPSAPGPQLRTIQSNLRLN
jgi:hypothetical protein